MVRRSAPKKKPPVFRSVLVELPEDRMLALTVRAQEAGLSAHVLLAQVVTDWLEQ